MANESPVMSRFINDFPPPPYFPLAHNDILKGKKNIANKPD